MQHRALVLMHLQNEVIDPEGTIGRKGNAAQMARRGTITRLQSLLASARKAGLTVVHVGSGYGSGSEDLCANVPLFAHHGEDRQMLIGTWAADFHPAVAPIDGEIAFYHFGVVAFEGTPLAKILTVRGVNQLFLAGVSTHYAILATTFDAADRGYSVTVVEDCCAAAEPELHTMAMATIRNFAHVTTSAEVATVFHASGAEC